MPGSLKCSYCQRLGVRSDECKCRKPRVSNTGRSPTRDNKIEMAIFVIIKGKSVKAWLNPSVSETLIGTHVAEFLIAETTTRPKKMIVRTPKGLELKSSVSVQMYTRRNNIIFVQGHLDRNIPEGIVVLGMEAISALGFKFYVGGQEAKTRVKAVPKPSIKTRTFQQRRIVHHNRKEADHHKEDDTISFLDEEERQHILNWK